MHFPADNFVIEKAGSVLIHAGDVHLCFGQLTVDQLNGQLHRAVSRRFDGKGSAVRLIDGQAPVFQLSADAAGGQQRGHVKCVDGQAAHAELCGVHREPGVNEQERQEEKEHQNTDQDSALQIKALLPVNRVSRECLHRHGIRLYAALGENLLQHLLRGLCVQFRSLSSRFTNHFPSPIRSVIRMKVPAGVFLLTLNIFRRCSGSGSADPRRSPAEAPESSASQPAVLR